MPTTTERQPFFVLHSYGNNAAKSRLKDALNRFVAEKYDSQNTPFAMDADRRKSSFKLEMNTVAGPDLINELRSSTVAGFEVRKRDTNVPEYMEESSILGDNAEGNIHIQYTSDDIWSDIGMTLDNLSDKIQNEEYPLAELVDDDPSTANALVESSGDHYHRINITKEELRMEKLIPLSEIEYDDQDGRVKLDVIGEISRDFLNGKLQEIGAPTLNQHSLLT
jgi:hypothetical protein